MTADRRDWVNVFCPLGCGWGVRIPPEQETNALAGHAQICSQNSTEEKTPTCPTTGEKLVPGVMCCGLMKRCPRIAECRLPAPPEASVSPSNELRYTTEGLTPTTGGWTPTTHPDVMQYDSGVRRTPKEGKVNWSLALDGPLLGRLAKHLTKGEETHGKRNWMMAHTEEDLERFRESAVRHFFQWLAGEASEDHFAATVFNMNGYEHTKEKLKDDRWPVDPDAAGYR